MTSEPRPNGRESPPVSVKGVCFDGAARVMLCLNWRHEWELPGGRPEAGEGGETCLEREILEEAGVIISVREALTEYAFQVLPGSWVHIVIYGCVPVGAPNLTPSLEHRTVAFIDHSELESLQLPEGYRQAIAAWRTR
ncbi:MAG TPA: NUDIX domain-containing protein [Solirubrobacteraceae bacterium]|jgi:ADP-ribose pyrophosphatase YjhB (NUDIX family)|nr:NUDIX domain-containing protein [Solirubrobacteraceae bacterium]